jgi:hypothetical protein
LDVALRYNDQNGVSERDWLPVEVQRGMAFRP